MEVVIPLGVQPFYLLLFLDTFPFVETLTIVVPSHKSLLLVDEKEYSEIVASRLADYNFLLVFFTACLEEDTFLRGIFPISTLSLVKY